jgi:hypothetical protein
LVSLFGFPELENSSKIEEVINRAKKSPDTLFSMDIEHSLSAITRILKLLNPSVEMGESLQDKDVHLKVEKKR